MDNRVLSQEEIEILLKGAIQEDPTPVQIEEILSDVEIDAIGEIANISMGSAATALSQLLGKRVEITTPQVKALTTDEIGIESPDPAVMVTVDYREGVEGSNFFILSQHDCAIIFDLMMGGEGRVETAGLNELQISAIGEAMNQMMGSAATALSSMFKKKVDITPPVLRVTHLANDQQAFDLLRQAEPLIRISFRLHVEGVIDSILAQIIPARVVKGMVDTMMKSVNISEENSEQKNNNITAHQEVSASILPSNVVSMPPSQLNARQSNSREKSQITSVQPAHFSELRPVNIGTLPENLELILDVPLQVSVELGKAKKTIRDIMSLGPGAVIELDRLAGEPVDMVVNGKLIAKCEVVVINETFGIRITDIINPAERLKSVN